MAANLSLQVKRGVKANIPSLLAGEFYWATDTLELFVGSTPTPINAFSSLIGAATNKQLPNGLSNFNTAAQSTGQLVAATPVYITISNVHLPATPVNGIVAGSAISWHIVMTKNANGTGATSVLLYMGTNGSTADTPEATQAFGAATASVDTLILDITIVCTSATPLGTYAFYWSICPQHSAATATGFGVINGTQYSGTVTGLTVPASAIFGVGIEAAAGGTMPTYTIQQVQARAYNLD